MIEEFIMEDGTPQAFNLQQVCRAEPYGDNVLVELPAGRQFPYVLKCSYEEFRSKWALALTGKDPFAKKAHEWGRWRSSHDHKEIIGLDPDGNEDVRFTINDDDPVAAMDFARPLNYGDAANFEAAHLFVSGALRNNTALVGGHLYHPEK
jgi:hypothetical protein